MRWMRRLWRAIRIRPRKYWRWPHRKESSGYHYWKRTDEMRDGGRIWRCIRCKATCKVWPPDTGRVLLRRGDRLVSQEEQQ